MPSFAIMRPRWTLMVFSTVPNAAAICLLLDLIGFDKVLMDVVINFIFKLLISGRC